MIGVGRRCFDLILLLNATGQVDDSFENPSHLLGVETVAGRPCSALLQELTFPGDIAHTRPPLGFDPSRATSQLCSSRDHLHELTIEVVDEVSRLSEFGRRDAVDSDWPIIDLDGVTIAHMGYQTNERSFSSILICCQGREADRN